MEASVQIPTPAEEDSDNVVTALETAAIFEAKGDGPEAVRWLKRAAESAGADGRDDRALSLARTAANLSEHLDGGGDLSDAPPSVESRERRLPKPPPRPATSVRPPPPSARHREPGEHAEAEAIPLSRANSASSTPMPPSVAPMPPSVKPKLEPSRPPSVAASGTVRPSYSPSPPKVVSSVRPAATTDAPEARSAKSSYGPAKPSEKPEKPEKPAVAASAHSSYTPSPPSVKPAVARPSNPSNGASKSVVPKPASVAAPVAVVAEAKPKLTEAPKAEETATPPTVSNGAAKHEAAPSLPATSSEPPKNLGRRHAARVSIEPSSGSKRFYVLRVLEEGEAVPDKGLEALVVLTDPNARFPD
jgi:hypothetical protein